MFPYFSTLALYIRVFFKHESSIVISDDISGFIQINMADLENLVEITVISDDISGFIQINLADLENLVGISTVSRLFP